MAYLVLVHDCAERFLDNESKEMQVHLLLICEQLGEDPFVDGESKFPFDAPPVVLRIWRDGHHWIVYHFDHDTDVVHVYNMGREGLDRPSFRCD